MYSENTHLRLTSGWSSLKSCTRRWDAHIMVVVPVLGCISFFDGALIRGGDFQKLQPLIDSHMCMRDAIGVILVTPFDVSSLSWQRFEIALDGYWIFEWSRSAQPFLFPRACWEEIKKIQTSKFISMQSRMRLEIAEQSLRGSVLIMGLAWILSTQGADWTWWLPWDQTWNSWCSSWRPREAVIDLERTVRCLMLFYQEWLIPYEFYWDLFEGRNIFVSELKETC